MADPLLATETHGRSAVETFAQIDGRGGRRVAAVDLIRPDLEAFERDQMQEAADKLSEQYEKIS